MPTRATAEPPLASADAHNSTLAVFAILAIALLNFGLNRGHGNFELLAAELLVVVVALCAFLAMPPVFKLFRGARCVPAAAGLVLFVQTVTLISSPPGPSIRPEAAGRTITAIVAILAIFGVGVLATSTVNWLGKWTGAVIALSFVILCGWVIQNSYLPFMDVYVFQQDSANAISRGINPYSITFANIYGPNTPFYAPEVVKGDRVTFGFPYMPLPLLMELGSWLMSGEVRYAHLLSVAAVLAILAFAEAGPYAVVACALLATSPTLPEVIFNGWTESLMLPWLALTAWAMRKRYSLASAIFFGLFLAGKQYCAVFVPLAWLLVPPGAAWKPKVGTLAIVAATVLVVSVPFAAWDFKAFWYSTVTIQVLQPYRPDALSFPALLTYLTGARKPPILAFFMIVPAYVAIFWKIRRTPSGLMAGLALVSVVFFAFNKQAFLNYYSLVVATLAISLAHLPGPASPPAPDPAIA